MASDPNRESMSENGPSDVEDAGVLNHKAARCRRLAAGISDKQASEVLTGMARNYQEAADRLATKG